MKQSGARSAPGFLGYLWPESSKNKGELSNPAREARRESFWGIYGQNVAKTTENEAIRRAKRAGKIFGVFMVKIRKAKENEATRRAKRAGFFWGIYGQKAMKT